MKAGLILASPNSTRAQTLPKCEEIRLNSSADRSGWTIFAMDRSTLAILPPVRYFLILNLFTNTPMGSESDRPSFLALRKMQ